MLARCDRQLSTDDEIEAAERPTISVVITNFNYARFIEQSIESALAQEYPGLELIVVDDGSTDQSRAVIERFADRASLIFKPNGGPASSMNAGFALARGDIVVFLDADDYLLPGALAAHAKAMHGPQAVRSQGYLAVIDEFDRSLDRRLPARSAEAGDLREHVLATGPGAYVSPPNSGSAWSRRFLERMFPLPERGRDAAGKEARLDGEAFLLDAAPLFGVIVNIDDFVAAYRAHGASMTAEVAKFTKSSIANVLLQYDERSARLAAVAAALGYRVDRSRWIGRNWRILALRYLDDLLHGRVARQNLTFLSAAIRLHSSGARRVLLSIMLINFRVMPKFVAVAIARCAIRLEYM